MQPSDFSRAFDAPTGDALFQHWLSACSADPWAPLSETAATPYRFIWGAWLKLLAASAVATRPVEGKTLQPWQQAQAVQILQFLNQSTRSQKQLDLPSDITRRRYWRVLERIYDHALLHGWVNHNPLDAVSELDRPPSEDPQGAILSPRTWRALLRQIPAATDLISARDRAVLLVLVHLGLSSEEVRALVLEDLLWEEASAKAGATLAQPANHADKGAAKASSARIHGLRITGLRAMQSRTLEVPPQLDEALRVWLGYRAGYAPMAQQPALFCTRKAPALSTHTVLHLVSKTLKAASASSSQELPPRMGPQVIRNTVIVQWLQSGLPQVEVLQRAGLKTPHALGHLQQFVNVE
jgi:integrase